MYPVGNWLACTVCLILVSPRALYTLQNYSADLLCSALAAAGLGTGDMLRLNDPRRPPFTVGGPAAAVYWSLAWPGLLGP